MVGPPAAASMLVQEGSLQSPLGCPGEGRSLLSFLQEPGASESPLKSGLGCVNSALGVDLSFQM